VPPLRERHEDIPALANHFLHYFCSKESRKIKQFQPTAMEALESYNWPGNVRELKNIVERLVIMTPDENIALQHLPTTIVKAHGSTSGLVTATASFAHDSYREARDQFEKEFLQQKLEENDWNVSRTAEVIEIERSNLHRKIKSFGIELKK